MSITIDITESGCLLTRKTPEGGIIARYVNPVDLGTVLSKQGKLDTGILPPATRYFSRGSGAVTMVLEVRPHVRPITTTNGGEMAVVPFPALLFKLVLAENASAAYDVRSVRVVAYKDPALTPGSQLYRFPYGNVYDDGRICWGSIGVPQVKEIVNASAICELFLTSMFNGHLGNGILRVPAGDKYLIEKGYNAETPITIGCLTASSWFSTKGIKVFPVEWLTPVTSPGADKATGFILGGNT